MQEKIESIEENVNKRSKLDVTTQFQEIVEIQKKELAG